MVIVFTAAACAGYILGITTKKSYKQSETENGLISRKSAAAGLLKGLIALAIAIPLSVYTGFDMNIGMSALTAFGLAFSTAGGFIVGNNTRQLITPR